MHKGGRYIRQNPEAEAVRQEHTKPRPKVSDNEVKDGGSKNAKKGSTRKS